MIIRFNVDYTEQAKDLLTELQEYLSSIDREGYNIVGENYREQSFLDTAKEVMDHNGNILLYEEDGKIVGLVAGIIYNDEVNRYDFKSPKRGRVTELIVNKDYRGRGIGTKLLDEMKKYLKEEGCEKVLVTVFGYNENAIEFYKKHGFHTRIMDMIED